MWSWARRDVSHRCNLVLPTLLRSGLAQRDQCAERAARRSKDACQSDCNGREWCNLLRPQQPKSAEGDEPTAHAAH